MNYSTTNGLYFRISNDTADPYIMQCCINKNKKLLEKKFFENDMLCSWSSKISADFTGDSNYIIGFPGNNKRQRKFHEKMVYISCSIGIDSI